MKGNGCERCNGTGYKGRVGLYEVMEVTEELRELILVGASGLELRRKAVEEGHDHAPPERPAQGQRRRDDDRRSRARDGEVAQSQLSVAPADLRTERRKSNWTEAARMLASCTAGTTMPHCRNC